MKNQYLFTKLQNWKVCIYWAFYIGKDVVIGNNVQISSNCHFDKGCKIGENTKIYSGVKFYDKSQIGNNCVFHSGAVIGSDGFGFAPNKKSIPENNSNWKCDNRRSC